MQLILFDTIESRQALLPFTYTKPIASIRVGALTIAEKWSHHFQTETSILTAEYLMPKYGGDILKSYEKLYVNAKVLPNAKLVNEIQKLPLESILHSDNEIIAFKTSSDTTPIDKDITNHSFTRKQIDSVEMIEKPYNIFQFNANEIKKDIKLISKVVDFQYIYDNHIVIYGEGKIFSEENVEIKAAIFDTTKGPVYLGKGSKVGIGSMIEGPFALGEYAQVNPGTKIRGGTTVGPYCKVGGELNNVVMQAYSNKGHDGFLGNSVIGEWCNLGADTNASNLKNNYSNVKVWDYKTTSYKTIDSQFCGLMMGDHSKTGINAMFNTATTVGICSNIFGADFPPKFIPSFSWGSSVVMEEFRLEKVFEMANNMMSRRDVPFTKLDQEILEYVFEETKKYRS